MFRNRDSVRKSLFAEYGDVSNVEYKDDSFKSTTTSPLLSGHKQHNAIKIGILLIVIAIVSLTGKTLPILFKEAGEGMLSKSCESYAWIQNNYESLVMPSLAGLLVTLFAFVIIYYDSDVPGLNPPSPFSPRKSERMRYAVHQETSSTLNYGIAICGGVATALFLYF